MARSRSADRATGLDAWALTDVVTRLRRVLRSSIRSDYPWETLPMAQVEILQRLRTEPGLRVNDLAIRHRLATNTVSALVQQLVAAGLVARTPDPADRRAVHVHLTAEGEQTLTGWQDAHARRLDAALSRLAPEQRSAVINALPALSQLVDELEAADSIPRTER
jgi:DNA-binding MarR family transcriptional regulator